MKSFEVGEPVVPLISARCLCVAGLLRVSARLCVFLHQASAVLKQIQCSHNTFRLPDSRLTCASSRFACSLYVSPQPRCFI